MKKIAIIQARMGSTRLPGKVMMDLAGQPMLARVVERTRRATTVDAVVVATTIAAEDAVICEFCSQRGYPCFRGSVTDVLDRYYGAATQFGADAVIRVTADNPIVDPDIIDGVVCAFAATRPDYASNHLHPRTYPIGLGVEIFTLDALRRAWHEGLDSASREHVTKYILDHPQHFRLLAVPGPTDWSALRWTVDTIEDLVFVRLIYNHFGHDRFSWLDALAVVNAHPEWHGINQHIRQKDV